MVSDSTVKYSDASIDPVILVGAGPVGHRFAKVFSELKSNRPLKIFSGEAFKPYDRVKLSQLLAQDIMENDIYNILPFDQSVELIENNLIVEIDRQAKKVLDSQGQWHKYSQLVLALGSDSFEPNIPNIDIKHVYAFRDLKDTQALVARNIGSRHTVVIGGGLLGIETAKGMLRNNTQVTIIQLGKYLMDKQLDATAAQMLEEKVSQLGIDVICNQLVSEIIADPNNHNTARPQVAGIKLNSGRIIDCDTVIISAGIRPRINLARDNKLHVDKGIKVNEHLQTNDENIYAIGDCAQFKEQLFGLVAPGFEHASVVAHHIDGEAVEYKGSINTTSLKVVGEKVFSVGETNPEVGKSIRTLSYRKSDEGCYRAIFTINNRLVGALALGDWSEQNRIRACITENRKVYFWHYFLFKFTGSLWQSGDEEDIKTWPSKMIVCNCTGVTKEDLSIAKKAGANTVLKLAEQTRASTVCGSCKPLLAQFTGDASPLGSETNLVYLKRISYIALIFLALFLISNPLPFSQTVQLFAYDQLWLDSLLKQISGFSLLSLAALSLLLSLNKRCQWFKWGKFTSWRVFHTVLGLMTIIILVAHTGINLGVNLNRWLMIDFLSIILLGGLAGLVVSKEKLFSAQQGKRIRGYFTWAHTLMFWPLPILLTFHIISVYYF